MPELYVTTGFQCRPDTLEALKTMMTPFVKETLAEDGCLFYGWGQDGKDPHTFTTIEHWNSNAAEAAHWETPHIQGLLKALGPLLEGEPKTSKYSVL